MIAMNRKPSFVAHQGGKSQLRRVEVAVGEAVTSAIPPLTSTTATTPPILNGAPTPSATEAPPSYAKALVTLAGPRYSYYVASATALGGVVGYALGGWMWSLAGIIGGNIATRLGTKYVCDSGKGDIAECDYATRWGVV